MTFAERLSELMAERGLNKLSLSRKINVSDRVVGAWVSGENGAKLDSAVSLAEYFEVSLDYLAGRSEVREMGIKKEPALGISENGRELLALYEQLPEREQLLLLGRVQNMVEQSSDTRRVFKAARAKGDGLTDAVVEIQKARMDKIAAAAETEKDL